MKAHRGVLAADKVRMSLQCMATCSPCFPSHQAPEWAERMMKALFAARREGSHCAGWSVRRRRAGRSPAISTFILVTIPSSAYIFKVDGCISKAGRSRAVVARLEENLLLNYAPLPRKSAVLLREFRIRTRQEMTTGTVKFFNSIKGFGFIEPEDGSKDAFVHISAVERAGLSSLSEGQKVSYELQRGQNGKTSAENLSLIE